MNWRVLGKGLMMLAVLAMVGFLLKSSPLGNFFEKSAIDDLVKDQGLKGEFLYLAAGAFLTAVGFSRQAVAFMGGCVDALSLRAVSAFVAVSSPWG